MQISGENLLPDIRIPLGRCARRYKEKFTEISCARKKCKFHVMNILHLSRLVKSQLRRESLQHLDGRPRQLYSTYP